jgi:hypothetical protein
LRWRGRQRPITVPVNTSSAANRVGGAGTLVVVGYRAGQIRCTDAELTPTCVAIDRHDH